MSQEPRSLLPLDHQPHPTVVRPDSDSTGPPNPLGAHPTFPDPLAEPSSPCRPRSRSPPSSPRSTADGSDGRCRNNGRSEAGRRGDVGGGGRSHDATRASELASSVVALTARLRHIPDFPIAGIDFVDILPLFADPLAHQTLLDALLHCLPAAASPPDVVVGLDARGFLFGPNLALRLNAAFAPVRKLGKLPGPCVTVTYQKEYGADLFQMQRHAVQAGQRVLIVDDIIATGGSAKAAADLVHQLGGHVTGFLFIVEVPGLNGRDKLGDVPVHILLDNA